MIQRFHTKKLRISSMTIETGQQEDDKHDSVAFDQNTCAAAAIARITSPIKSVGLELRRRQAGTSNRGARAESRWENISNSRGKLKCWMKRVVGLPEFESGSQAPKARRMDQATPQTHASSHASLPGPSLSALGRYAPAYIIVARMRQRNLFIAFPPSRCG